MNRADFKQAAALAALQGFCANPSVFAPNGNTGWGLVNCTNEQLAWECWEMACALLNMEDAKVTASEHPAPAGGGAGDAR